MIGSRGERGEGNEQVEGTVSLMAEVPESLLTSMRTFIDHHPNWDQYRLVQAALAGFLVQHGCQDRAVTRCYLANLFPGQSRFHGSTHETPRKLRLHNDQGRKPERQTDWEAA
jgi:hypothetical protein